MTAETDLVPGMDQAPPPPEPEPILITPFRIFVILGVAGLIALIGFYFNDFFGPGTWGTGGNMIAWVVCGILAFSWQHRQNLKLHRERLALARAQHQEALMAAALRHQDMKNHVTQQHEDMKNHVTAACAP